LNSVEYLGIEIPPFWDTQVEFLVSIFVQSISDNTILFVERKNIHNILYNFGEMMVLYGEGYF